MTTVRVLSCFTFVCLSFLGMANSVRSQDAKQIFDGKSFDGWEGDWNHWRLQDGCIVGEIPKGKTLSKNTWLVWRDGRLKDFELNLQFRISGLPDANSGIQIRCQVDSVDHVSGYQADLDMGATWLGRIYDEHGRALLVERGSRVHLRSDGTRLSQAFAPPHQYKVLIRDGDWNDYRIVAVGERIDVFINGTLFTALWDQQQLERDLEGELAFQLHAGPETRIELKEIQLENLTASDTNRLAPFPELAESPSTTKEPEGVLPVDTDGKVLNFDFEEGNLNDWLAVGAAFEGQPLDRDGITQRWPGQSSNKSGRFFVGGYELAQDQAVGTLESTWFQLSKRYAGFLIGGGQDRSTRVEIRRRVANGAEPEVIAQATGNNQEQMRRVAVDLSAYVGDWVQVRLVDENPGGWGHLNFDDFRLFDEPPSVSTLETVCRILDRRWPGSFDSRGNPTSCCGRGRSRSHCSSNRQQPRANAPCRY
jgi:hypothetical protein